MKQVYAMSTVDLYSGDVKAGKWYPVDEDENGYGFRLRDDSGDSIYSAWENSAHQDGHRGQWLRHEISIEETGKGEHTMKFKAMKFRVNNPEHSERVQRILFEMGYEWGMRGRSVSYTNKRYLFTGTVIPCSLTFTELASIFENDGRPEIDVSWLDTADDETIEIEGRTYRKSDVVDRLSELDPVE